MMVKKRPHIGLRQAQQLCQKRHEERLAFLSEGLPIILASSQGFWMASCQLKDRPREAEVLKGFAEEEASKILILMDAVRCPKSVIDSKVRRIVGWFYNHLARLLYVEAMSWRYMHVAQLREYIDQHRKSHYIEADYSILPNWNIYERESVLYADILSGEEGEPGWNDPNLVFQPPDPVTFASDVPQVLKLVEAMAALGIFTPQGLKATSDIWDQLAFTNTEDKEDARRLTSQLIERLCKENLPKPDASQDHANEMFINWPIPMYDFDFRLMDVSLAELEQEREVSLWGPLPHGVIGQ